MSLCDATTEQPVAGDDLVWSYLLNEDLSDDDTADWSDLLVEFRAAASAAGALLASTEGDPPTVVTTGGFDGEAPATNFATGVVCWYVPSAKSAEWADTTVYMHVRVKVGGVETTIWPPTAIYIGAQVATRGEGS